jgi:hypothetical protein
MSSASNKENTRGNPPPKKPQPPPPKKSGAEKIGERVAPSAVDAIKKRKALLDEI